MQPVTTNQPALWPQLLWGWQHRVAYRCRHCLADFVDEDEAGTRCVYSATGSHELVRRQF